MGKPVSPLATTGTRSCVGRFDRSNGRPPSSQAAVLLNANVTGATILPGSGGTFPHADGSQTQVSVPRRDLNRFFPW